MCHQSNISAAVPQSKIELKEGMIATIQNKLFGHGFKIGQDVRLRSFSQKDGNAWICYDLDNTDYWYVKPSELSNPRWPEKMEKEPIERKYSEDDMREAFYGGMDYSQRPNAPTFDVWIDKYAPNHLTSK